ncbi:hypothetical protein Hypma_001918 [Hypsizygus marmoreus]|uniref:BTB domain-containing protein n=1 Tax=Hypsizygus marmoreus TaxID=39966 RepID=A0A369J5R9_HYPMA|nr:hypothetical protein Hypma_001918 [Hypsizygus marmoreus]
MDRPHPIKRQRTDDLELSRLLEDSTRSTIWFDDGSVILNAENTLFRVHRSILSSHSSVFDDLLGALSSEVQVDGCPVLTVQDSAEDMSHFLKALTDRSYYREKDAQSIEITSSILRLSMKYCVDHLRDEASSRLQYEFPASLESYDRRTLGSRIKSGRGYIVDCISLMREVGLISALPTCFLTLGQYRLPDILNGKLRPDGSRAILPLEDQRICVTGIYELHVAIAQEMYGWVDIEPGDVRTCKRVGCSDSRFRLSASLWKPTNDKPLKMLRQWWPEWLVGLCGTCASDAKEEYEAGRRRIWERLPSFFGLPNWKDMPAQ